MAKPDLSGSQARTASGPTIIGWREAVSLPDWGIRCIKTKIDTGARTSAIHVDNLHTLPNGRVRFDVIVKPSNGPDTPAVSVPVETELVRYSRVRSAGNVHLPRPVVRTRMRLGSLEREIELSLVSRHGLLCRLLLGRQAIKGDILIDPSTARRLSKSKSAKACGSITTRANSNGTNTRERST